MFHHLELIVKRFKIIANFGEGKFGNVYKVVDNEDDNESKIAREIKLPKKLELKTVLDDLTRDIDSLSKLEHKNVIMYYESFLDRMTNNFYLITEYCEGGNLSYKIEEYKMIDRKFSENNVINWLSQLVSAIDYLHNKNIVHGDIRTGNIFMSYDKLKLGDFGLPMQILATSLGIKLNYSLYRSPEVLNGGDIHKKEADMWGLGIVMYEICVFELPFHKQNEIMEIEPDFDKLDYYFDLKDIIRRLLKKDPNRRNDILKAKYDLERLLNASGIRWDQKRPKSTVSVKNLNIKYNNLEEDTTENNSKTHVSKPKDIILQEAIKICIIS